MAEVLTGVNGDIIRWAREHYNMTTEEMAKAVGVDISLYENWETGKDYPTYAKLKKLSNVLRKPSAVFFLPSPPNIPTSKGDLRTLPNVVVNKFSKNIIFQFEKAKLYQLNLKELYSERYSIISQRDGFPKKLSDLSSFLREKIGITLLEQKSVGDAAVLFEKFRKKFYSLGIYVFKDAFKDKSISGLCLNDNNYPVIVINNTMAFTRQLFTLFHELYHLISNTSGVEIIRDDYYLELDEQQKKIERSCDIFANDFLVPIDDFLQEFRKVTLDEYGIESLASLYSVSKEAIMYKLYSMKKMSPQEYNSLKEKFYGDAIRTHNTNSDSSGGNHYNTKLSYLGYQYTGEVLKKYTSGVIDEVRASEMLQSKIDQLPKIESLYFRRETR